MTIEELVKNQKTILDAKKSNIVTHKFCDHTIVGARDVDGATKEVSDVGVGDTILAVINTTNFLDSHMDVHAKSIWNKSAKEQNGKVYYVIDHELKIGKVIAKPDDVEIEVREMDWKELGRDYKGTTNALIFHVRLKDYANKDFIEAIKAGFPLQNSIRMRYIDVKLAVNKPQYEENYKVWKDHINEVANIELAEEKGYFYYVAEAQIYMEGSAVLFGSNDATPILENKSEPSGDTRSNKEKAKDTPVWYNLM